MVILPKYYPFNFLNGKFYDPRNPKNNGLGCDFTYLTNPPWFYQAKAISSDSEIFGMNDPIDCFANIEEAFTS